MLERMQAEVHVSLQVQDYKAIFQRADQRTESITHTPDYSVSGNRVCIVFPRQMLAPGEIDGIFWAKDRPPFN